jgi:transcriptional regulator with XRE-family HTH domain
MPRKSKFKLKPLNISDETIGQRIARIRKAKDLTQKELAQKIGITRSRLSKYEIDRIHLLDEIIIRFAIALDVSSDEILRLKEYTLKE